MRNAIPIISSLSFGYKVKSSLVFAGEFPELFMSLKFEKSETNETRDASPRKLQGREKETQKMGTGLGLPLRLELCSCTYLHYYAYTY